MPTPEAARAEPRIPAVLERLVVYGNPAKAGITDVLSTLGEWTTRNDVELWVERSLRDRLQSSRQPDDKQVVFFGAVEDRRAALDGVNALVVCLGGDGTLIHAVHRLWPLTPPVMAVHLGSLSFNATVEAGQITQAIEAWMAGQAKVTPRMVLRVGLYAGEDKVAEHIAVNDVVLAKRSEARLINLTLRQGDELVLSFAGDGIIVSTPTGSTAYNLSAGGPIVFPSMQAMIATAICPHTLAARPVILPPHPAVTMEFIPHHGREHAMVWVDGQECRSAEPGDRIEMQAAAIPLQLVHMQGAHYFHRLRKKLLWSGHLRPTVAEDGEADRDGDDRTA